MQRAFAGSGGARWSDRHQLFEWQRRGSAADRERQAGRSRGRCGGATSTGFGEELGSAIRGRDRAGASFGAGAPGSRDSLLTAAAGNARFPLVSRLHGVTPGSGNVLQCCPQRQQSVRAIRLRAGHWRKTENEDNDRRRTGGGKDGCRRAGRRDGTGCGDSLFSSEGGAVHTLANF